ncbi:MAG TPA: polymer-forming cytoskeletal protein [Anaerolineae bacterium]|nr:polymer-forming cytoskeletal protein [Anaerolineae bacterium]
MSRKLLILTFLFCFLIPTTAFAAPTSPTAPAPDKVIGEGETHRGELTLFGDNLTLDSGGNVDGDVVVMGGNATLNGFVDGDLVIFGGDVTINSTAEIDGDCVILGGHLTNNGGIHNCASIGENFRDLSFDGFNFESLLEIEEELAGLSAQIESPTTPSRPTAPPNHYRAPSLISRIIGAAFSALAAGFITLIVTALFPRNIRQISATVSDRPVVSGTVGLVTGIAGISLLLLVATISALLLIVCIGLLGFPILFALGAILGIAYIAGGAAIGLIMGQKLVPALNLNIQSTAAIAAIGTFVLSISLGLIGSVDFWMGDFVQAVLNASLSCIGLGAAVLTQLGRQPYPPHSAPPADPGKVADAMDNMPLD